jgi:hypothetical protein
MAQRYSKKKWNKGRRERREEEIHKIIKFIAIGPYAVINLNML